MATQAKPRKTSAPRARAGAKESAADACGCATHDRKALAVEPDIKEANLVRLRRIEGQVRGLQQMVLEERYCADILMQLSAAQEALRGVARELMRNHLRHCATSAIVAGGEEAERMYDELLRLMAAHAR